MDGRRGLALVGFMGAGKSTVGARAATALGWRHVDLDAELVRRFGPITAQFDAVGEAGFRAREAALLAEVDPARTVLSTGGGAPVAARSRVLLESRFRTVWLEVDLPTAASRIRGEHRPLWPVAAERFAARSAVYASARSRVDARGDPDAVTRAALAAAAGPAVHRVELGERAYDVVFAEGFAGLADRLPPDVRVITDETVARLHAPALAASVGREPDLVLPPGESTKHTGTWERVVDALLASGVRRSTAILALGGGVIGDLVGFAAATVHRGVPLVQLPTTLLAMLDASVGGKVAVDHPRGKNLIGAIHQPMLVWAAGQALGTLPARERVAGLAEALKVAAVLDPVLLDELEAGADLARAGDPGLLERVVRAGVAAKAAVVARDERERGERRLLNAGHTVGHALERASGFRMLHGEAVAVGLVREARWAEREGLCEPGLPDRLERIARALGLPTDAPALDRETILDAAGMDKKVDRDILWLPVAVRAGVGASIPLPVHRLPELFA